METANTVGNLDQVLAGQYMAEISGTALANSILSELKERVSTLKKRGVVPGLAVIQVGDRPESNSYIRKKQRAGGSIGITVRLVKYEKTPYYQTIAEQINQLNNDPAIHGIIMQQPLPPLLTTQTFNTIVNKAKDVDGFREKSPYKPPIVNAVLHILRETLAHDQLTRLLKSKKIVILGRGATAGRPIAQEFLLRKIPHIIVGSGTENKEEFMKEADIIISCVGKRGVVKPECLKEGVLLIGVGITRGNDGRLHGDYDVEKIKDIASYYTPTPGGVGPLTVMFLLKNVIKAAEGSSLTRNRSSYFPARSNFVSPVHFKL